METMSFSYVQPMNLLGKSIEWIVFQNNIDWKYILLTMKYMGFQILYKTSKIEKTMQTDRSNPFLPTTWERGFEEMLLAESQRQLWCII